MNQASSCHTGPPYSGGCLCGQIRFAIDEPLQHVVHCHCSFCRKTHGSAFATYGRLPQAAFHWLGGAAENLGSYRSSPGVTRYFCNCCGSVMPIAPSPAPLAFIPLGSLDEAGSNAPQMHIFTASKAPWYHISDTLPQQATWPPGLDLAVVEDRTVRRLRGDDAAALTHGSCLCNRVSFQFDGNPQTMRNCHCSRCRKSRSAAHASNLFVTTEQFRWNSGQEHITRFDLPGARRFGVDFCAHCGSCVPRVTAAHHLVNIPAGCLDDDPGLAPVMHIYVESKAPWFEIEDDLPQYETHPQA